MNEIPPAAIPTPAPDAPRAVDRTGAERLSAGRAASLLVAVVALFAVCVAFGRLERGRIVRIGPGPRGTEDVQAAIDRVSDGGGGTVLVAAGRHPLRTSIRLRDGVAVVGERGRTVFEIGPGLRALLAKDVPRGATEIELTDATGFEVGDGIALEDDAGHGFQVSTAVLAARLGPHAFRLSEPVQDEYRLSRRAHVKRAYSGVGGWHVRNASVSGVTIEGTHGRPGSEYLGGCRGAGIYLYACEDVVVRGCTVRRYDGDAVSFQRNCRGITVADCLIEENGNAGLHPGSDSHSSVVRGNLVRNNGYVGLFVCVGVKRTLFEGNEIVGNRGCGVSIGLNDSDNVFRGNRIVGNAETGVLFRRDSPRPEEGAHRNVFVGNVVRDNLGPRPAKSNSRPDSAGRACVVVEGTHLDLVFRGNDFGFAAPHPGAAILSDAVAANLQARDNRLENVSRTVQLRGARPD